MDSAPCQVESKVTVWAMSKRHDKGNRNSGIPDLLGDWVLDPRLVFPTTP